MHDPRIIRGSIFASVRLTLVLLVSGTLTMQMLALALDGDTQQAQSGGKREEETAEAIIERQAKKPRVCCSRSAFLPMYVLLLIGRRIKLIQSHAFTV